MSKSLDLSGRINSPIGIIDRNYSWMIDARSFDDTVLDTKKNEKRFYYIILNYGFSAINPLPYDAYSEGGRFLTREQILAHEVGHHLAKDHKHDTKGYKYTDKGLSSNNPQNFEVTIKNVITIIENEENQKGLFD